ncbi:hypothetical protein FB567DRAFT_564797 [Paraphoma chrysanthemicola]|uniref:Ankyrin n=1 Tax=Paraphoma chrysanthemicola TaxID=798071 RepID=A0A8K0VS44_9PLEO|nr:hypothetical protein FB567DRAFT_564797 [Paraphoma chrysanthemicola]
MDPLSIAGSIAGLISLGDTIFRKLYHYTKDVKNAEKEVQDLKNEVAGLNGVLHNLHLVAQDLEASTPHHSIRAEHIVACLDTLYKLDAAINKVGLSDKGKIRSTIHKLAWPFKAVNTKQFIEDIREHRNNVNFALSADSMTTLLKCLSKQDILLQDVEHIEDRLREKDKADTRIQLDKERQKILSSFLVVSPEEGFRTGRRLRHPTTGFWLTESETFKDWLRGSNTHLWLSGIPGAGKTVLSSLIIQQCLTQAGNDKAVAYFYCDYKDNTSQSVVNILSSLASQLARQHEAAFESLKNLYSKLHSGHQVKRTPEAEELVQTLQTMSEVFEDVRIVVDGVDECGRTAGEVSLALKLLAEGQVTISLCCLSRDELEIREELQPPFCIHIEIAAHTEDLQHYVRTEMAERIKRKKLRLKSNDLKDEIVDQLVSRADGMFRWVSCQIDHLCDLPSDALRRKALTQLPKTLSETYERILMRVPEPARPVVLRTLQWIAYATPKLALNELTEIVALGDQDEDLDSEACPEPEDLLRQCGSLIRRSEESLELAHFTVQEFLESISPEDGNLRQFRLSPLDKSTLAKTCVHYLCLPSFDLPPSWPLDDSFKDFWFYRYACLHLLRYLEDLREDRSLFERLQQLFHPRKSYNLTGFLLQHLALLNEWSDEQNHCDPLCGSEQFVQQICSNEFGSLHAAAMCHLGEVCEWLIGQGCDINRTSPLGVPLECAFYERCLPWDTDTHLHQQSNSEHNAQKVIHVLLDAGASCDLPRRHGESLSMVALYGGSDDVLSRRFMLMLKHGMSIDSDAVELIIRRHHDYNMQDVISDMNQIDDLKITPEAKLELMSYAQEHESQTFAKLPDAETMGEEAFAKAIAYTIKFGPISALKDFTRDSRFSVDMKPYGDRTSLLHLAAKHNSPDAMGLLLDLEADPAALTHHGGTVLVEAIQSGFDDEKVLCRLIDGDIADIQDEMGRTAWHAAAHFARPKILQLLVSRYGKDSPELYKADGTGRTPLLHAIMSKQDDCASMILSCLPGVTNPLADPRVFHLTVALGRHTLLKEMLDLGNDFSMTCCLTMVWEKMIWTTLAGLPF